MFVQKQFPPVCLTADVQQMVIKDQSVHIKPLSGLKVPCLGLMDCTHITLSYSIDHRNVLELSLTHIHTHAPTHTST